MTEPLTPEVRKEVARTSLRWNLPAMAGLAVGGIAIALVLALSLRDAADDRGRAEDRRVAACRDRNSAQEVGRIDLHNLLDGIHAELPDATEAINRIEGRMSTAVDTDSDCDGDGWLTDADYSVPKPAGLPIQLPTPKEGP